MFQIAGGAVGLGITTLIFLSAANNEISEAATQVGITLTGAEVTDVQGVLIGTETSQQLIAQAPGDTPQLTQIVSDSFVTGFRTAFSLDAVLALVGVAIAWTKVGGPLSRFGKDVEKQ